ncbi:7761_t:CDS:2 [Entrophospora sp. SA101]|nr:7761_t:CDS:2 [Entrophospora sp. SA101]CAJ0869928.1 1415_t:CDS:2 [Entrophospora sp. SA101]CAJ0906895.1 6451_t:CDS:2 [Entrophospora sp. SA101]
MASTSFESFSQLINNSPSLVWHETFLPLNILTTLHAIYITLNYKNSLKHSKVPWLQGFFAVIVMSVGGSTSSGIDSIRYDSRNKDPDLSNSLVAMILCGSPFWSFTTPSVLLQPSYDMKSSFLLSLFYISTTTTSTLTIDQGRTFSILLAIAFNLVKLKELNESSSLRKLEDIEKEDIKMEDIKMENIKKKD